MFLLDLPSEVRQKVYEHYAEDITAVLARSEYPEPNTTGHSTKVTYWHFRFCVGGDDMDWADCIGLTRVCSKIHNELLPMLASTIGLVLSISGTWIWEHWKRLPSAALACLPPEYNLRVRHLTFNAYKFDYDLVVETFPSLRKLTFRCVRHVRLAGLLGQNKWTREDFERIELKYLIHKEMEGLFRDAKAEADRVTLHRRREHRLCLHIMMRFGEYTARRSLPEGQMLSSTALVSFRCQFVLIEMS